MVFVQIGGNWFRWLLNDGFHARELALENIESFLYITLFAKAILGTGM